MSRLEMTGFALVCAGLGLLILVMFGMLVRMLIDPAVPLIFRAVLIGIVLLFVGLTVTAISGGRT